MPRGPGAQDPEVGFDRPDERTMGDGQHGLTRSALGDSVQRRDSAGDQREARFGARRLNGPGAIQQARPSLLDLGTGQPREGTDVSLA